MRALHDRSRGETAKLAQGESNDDRCIFMEENDNESIDDLDFVTGVFKRESDQPLIVVPKRK